MKFRKKRKSVTSIQLTAGRQQRYGEEMRYIFNTAIDEGRSFPGQVFQLVREARAAREGKENDGRK
jgi:hypothetical protein